MIDLDSIVKIIIFIVTICFILILLIKRFFYFRPTYEFLYPKAQFEDMVEGGIHSWFLPSTLTNKVVLFCHGNAGNLSHRQEKVISLNQLGYSVLIFDYRGFGQSKGVPNEEICYQNACMFAEMLIKKFGKENIIGYGESLGASIASYVCLRYGLPVLIIESGLPSVISLLKNKLKILGIFKFIFYEFDTVSYLKSYKGRTLVLHARNDEIVPWECTEEMRGLAEKVIEMTGSHNNPSIPWEEIQKFIG